MHMSVKQPVSLDFQRGQYRDGVIPIPGSIGGKEKLLLAKEMEKVKIFVAEEIDALLDFVGGDEGSEAAASQKLLKDITEVFRRIIKRIMYFNVKYQFTEDEGGVEIDLRGLWDEIEEIDRCFEGWGVPLNVGALQNTLAAHGQRYWQDFEGTELLDYYRGHRGQLAILAEKCVDPKVKLEERRVKAESFKKDPRFRDLWGYPGLIMVAVCTQADSENFLLNVVGEGRAALEEEFPEFKDNPRVLFRAQIRFPKDPNKYLDRISRLGKKILDEDEFACFRSTPSIVSIAVEGWKNPRKKLRELREFMGTYERAGGEGHPMETDAVLMFVFREYADPERVMIKKRKVYDQLILMKDFSFFKKHRHAVIHAVKHSEDPESYLKELLEFIAEIKESLGAGAKTDDQIVRLAMKEYARRGEGVDSVGLPEVADF